MFDVILVRHAESQPDWNLPLPAWPLSKRGEAQALDLVARLEALSPDRILSSPYPRAIDTVQPFAAKHAVTVDIIDDLRERTLSGEVLKPDGAFLDAMRLSFEDVDFCLPGGESVREVAERALGALEAYFHAHGGGRVLASSHGNTITAILAAIDPTVGYEDWETLGNPALRRVCFDGQTWRRAELPTASSPRTRP